MPESYHSVIESIDVTKIHRENRLFNPQKFVLKPTTFGVGYGEKLGIIGESGSGKSTLARLLLGLDRPTLGDVFWKGKNLRDYSSRLLRTTKPKFQMLFQDSSSSLHPLMTVRDIFRETRNVLENLGLSLSSPVSSLLDIVQLGSSVLDKFPRELSGGQRQRVALARCLATAPEVLIADEPTSSLDCVIKNQMLNLFQQVNLNFEVAIIIVSHDLSVIRCLCDNLLVMKNGEIVERGETRKVLFSPRCDYTRKLIESDYSLTGKSNPI